MKEGIKLIGKTILGYTIEEEIGSGGFGTVYKAYKRDESGTFIRAIKHISLPTKKQYNDVLNSMGGDYAKADNYFNDILNDLVSEIKILYNLTEQGVLNVVRYTDHHIEKQQNPIKYDIYLSMEYLTPFDEYIQTSKLAVRDVIKLGKDISAALIACHKNTIMHRDIKDENIFVSNDGTYKLGDFGVSKKMQDSSRAESMKGTPNYIAPEVYLGKGKYDCTVDIYSLGIVLYKLLNYNRNPFLPEYPLEYNSVDEDKAFEMRMKGDTPPAPLNANNKLGEVILKAISIRENRYNDAAELYECLNEIEKSLTNEELNKVVISPIKNIVDKKPEPTPQIQSDKNLKETIGEDYNVTNQEEKETGNGALFETHGDDYTPPVIKREESQTESIVTKDEEAEDCIEDVEQEKPLVKTKTRKKTLLYVGMVLAVFVALLGFKIANNIMSKDNWTGFSHVYNVTAEGKYADGKSEDETGEKFEIDSETIKMALEDNIPKKLPLDQEYNFEFTIYSPDMPESIMVLAGKGGGYVNFEYISCAEETSKAYIKFPWEFQSNLNGETLYSPGEKIRFRIVVEYRTKNDDGSTRYEKIYLDKTALTLTK